MWMMVEDVAHHVLNLIFFFLIINVILFYLSLELYYIGNEKMCMCTFFLSHELEKEEKVELTEATSFYGEDHEITF